MSGPAVSVSGLLALLDAVGASLTLDGDRLALTGKRPPVALLDAVKTRRGEVIDYLRGEDPAKVEAADSGPALLPSPDFSEVEKAGGEVVPKLNNLPPPWEALPETLGNVSGSALPAGPSSSPGLLSASDTPQASAYPLPDWPTLSASPGHCGSCARWEVAPDWGKHMGTCACPASGWPDNTRPLAIHEGHRCAAYRGDGEEIGRGWKARASAKRDGPAPLPPVPLEDSPRRAVST